MNKTTNERIQTLEDINSYSTAELTHRCALMIEELKRRGKIEIFLGLSGDACVQADVLNCIMNGPLLQVNAKIFHPKTGAIEGIEQH